MKKLVLGVLGTVVVLGALFGVYYYLNQEFAAKDHEHTRDELYLALADGQYDKFGETLVDLAGTDINTARLYTRRFIVTFYDKNGKEIDANEHGVGKRVSGLAFICGKYVITRARLLNPQVAGIQDPSVVKTQGFFLLADSSLDKTDPDQTFEALKGVYVNHSDARDFVVFERMGNPFSGKFIINGPDGCGFDIGKTEELKVDDALYLVGSTGVKPGSVILVSQGISGGFLSQGSMGPYDSGSPIFAVRDGRLELIAMNRGYLGVFTEGAAVSFDTIIEELKIAKGIDLLQSKAPQNSGPDKDNPDGPDSPDHDDHN